jgi:hypothetical protein
MLARQVLYHFSHTSSPTHCGPHILGAVAEVSMAGTCELGLLLALLLPVVSASLPGTMVRLNKAALNYGKRRTTSVCNRSCVCMCAQS